MKINLLKYIRFLIVIAVSLSLMTCSGNSQFTKKLEANTFYAKLYGKTTKTISVDLGSDNDVDWISLEWAADYRWFQIEQVFLKGKDICQKGSGPTALFLDRPKFITPDDEEENRQCISPEPDHSGSITDSFSEGREDELKLKITYAPLEAHEKDKEPHNAYLLVVTGESKKGTIRIELTGIIPYGDDAICDESAGEDCNFSDTSGLTPKKYTLVSNKLDIFTCHPEIAEADLDNDELHPNTRHDAVTVEDPFVFYLSSDGNMMHIVRDDPGGLLPTVPSFKIPMPDPSLPIDELEVELLPPVHNVECPLDSSGGFRCDGVQLWVFGGIVGVSDFIVSTGNETPSSPECDNFGIVSGDGGIRDRQMTVVTWGTIQSNPLDIYIDALVVAILPLEIVE